MSPFLQGFTALLLFQCAGEGIKWLFALSIPGPVVGMLLLFLWLRLSDYGSAAITLAAEGLGRHLSLLFVPAGVGVTLYLRTLAQEWVAIAVTLLVSTTLTIVVVGWTFSALLRFQSAARRASTKARDD